MSLSISDSTKIQLF